MILKKVFFDKVYLFNTNQRGINPPLQYLEVKYVFIYDKKPVVFYYKLFKEIILSFYTNIFSVIQ